MLPMNERQFPFRFTMFPSAYHSHISKSMFLVADLMWPCAYALLSLPPIIDPTHLESVLSTGALTITLNAQREICVLSKAGGTPLLPADIMSVVHVGVERVRDLMRIMDDALERDRGRRVIEVT